MINCKSIFTASDIEKVRVRKFSISTSLLIRASLEKGFRCVYLPERVIQISKGAISYYFKGVRLPCNNAVASNLSCNKYFLRRLLKMENLPTPRTITLRHPNTWKTVLSSSLDFPLVVKPINASHSNGASMNITTPDELKRAVVRAFSYVKKNKKGTRILVEEYFAGHDLRLLVVDGRVISSVIREPAHVTGDGHNTIRQLIHAFNEQWTTPIKYDLPLCPIPLDSEVSRYLARNNLTLNSILPKGKKSYVRWNANVSTGGRASIVTNSIHPNLKKLAVQVAKLSHLKIGGVDILCKDLSSGDISANNISILEINDSPGIDIHHFPVTGIGEDVATVIIDHIFNTPRQAPEVEPAYVETFLSDLRINAPKPKTQVYAHEKSGINVIPNKLPAEISAVR